MTPHISWTIIRRPESVRRLTERLDSEGMHATTVINVFEAVFAALAVGGEKSSKMRHKLSEALQHA